MKKSLLIVLMAFTLNAFSQSKPFTSLPPGPGENSLHYKLQQQHPKPAVNGILSSPQQHIGSSHLSRELFGLVQRFDSTYMWGWDTLGAKLRLESKTTDITYNADNYPLSLTLASWDGSTWENSLQFGYTYDANNNETSLSYKSWNGSSWVNVYQSLYTIDGNNNRITELSQVWLGTSWLSISNYIYTYNGNHQVLTETDQTWTGIEWLNDYKYTHTYTNNNETNYLSQSWNDVDGVWVNENQVVSTYDGNNNLLTYTYQTWNGLSWDNGSLSTFTYDGNNNQITSLQQYWDNTVWVNISKTNNTYSGHLLTNSLSQNWNGASYDNAGRVTNTYNGQLLTKSIEETWDGNTWKYSTIYFYSYGENDFILGEGSRSYDGIDNVIESGDSTHYFFKSVSGTKDISTEDASLSIFPNPSNGKFTISTQAGLGDIEIFNTIGERVYFSRKVNGQASTEINLSGMSSGVYHIVIRDGNVVTNRKMMIQ